MEGITKDRKISIIKQQLEMLTNTLYLHEINTQVAKTCGDTDMLKANEKAMSDLIKKVAAYETILKDVNNDK